jgi:hypothetical protein
VALTSAPTLAHTAGVAPGCLAHQATKAAAALLLLARKRVASVSCSADDRQSLQSAAGVRLQSPSGPHTSVPPSQ